MVLPSIGTKHMAAAPQLGADNESMQIQKSFAHK